MIGRVRTRQEFATLSRSGNRTSATFLWCNWCFDPTASHIKVAFAVTRSYGPAVKRNLLRRRVRAVLNMLDQQDPLPPVTLLIGVRRSPATGSQQQPTKQEFGPTYQDLERDVTQMVAAIRRRAVVGQPALSP